MIKPVKVRTEYDSDGKGKIRRLFSQKRQDWKIIQSVKAISKYDSATKGKIRR